jgi:hypothetical protein
MNDLYGALGRRSPSLHAAYGSRWHRRSGATFTPASKTFGRQDPKACRQPARRRQAAFDALSTVGKKWPTMIADVVRKVRQKARTNAAVAGNGSAEGAPPASTDIDGLSRFYLCLFQSMTIEPEDGTTPVALRGLAAGRWRLGRATLRMVDRNCAGLCRFSTDTVLGASQKREGYVSAS